MSVGEEVKGGQVGRGDGKRAKSDSRLILESDPLPRLVLGQPSDNLTHTGVVQDTLILGLELRASHD